MTIYRNATSADGPALDTFARAIWIETFQHSASPADIAAYVDGAYGPGGALIRDLADPAVRFRLAAQGDEIVGYAKLQRPWLPTEAIPRGGMQLSQLYVSGIHHGGGIAATLLDWTIGTARASGANALYLTVWEGNARARRFYDKHGLVHVGDYAFQTGNQVDRDLIMRLTL